jgi:hypothetical protein
MNVKLCDLLDRTVKLQICGLHPFAVEDVSIVSLEWIMVGWGMLDGTHAFRTKMRMYGAVYMICLLESKFIIRKANFACDTQNNSGWCLLIQQAMLV